MDLHDATLELLVVDWSEGGVSVHFRIAGGTEVVLTAQGLRHLDLPRSEPWGPSGSVNRVAQGDDRLTIEMQSGDVVVIEAAAFSTD
jgi:hypothetical protein